MFYGKIIRTRTVVLVVQCIKYVKYLKICICLNRELNKQNLYCTVGTIRVISRNLTNQQDKLIQTRRFTSIPIQHFDEESQLLLVALRPSPSARALLLEESWCSRTTPACAHLTGWLSLGLPVARLVPDVLGVPAGGRCGRLGSGHVPNEDVPLTQHYCYRCAFESLDSM